MKAGKELKEKISAQVNFRDNGVQEISLPLNNISQKNFGKVTKFYAVVFDGKLKNVFRLKSNAEANFLYLNDVESFEELAAKDAAKEAAKEKAFYIKWVKEILKEPDAFANSAVIYEDTLVSEYNTCVNAGKEYAERYLQEYKKSLKYAKLLCTIDFGDDVFNFVDKLAVEDIIVSSPHKVEKAIILKKYHDYYVMEREMMDTDRSFNWDSLWTKSDLHWKLIGYRDFPSAERKEAIIKELEEFEITLPSGRILKFSNQMIESFFNIPWYNNEIIKRDLFNLIPE